MQVTSFFSTIVKNYFNLLQSVTYCMRKEIFLTWYSSGHTVMRSHYWHHLASCDNSPHTCRWLVFLEVLKPPFFSTPDQILVYLPTFSESNAWDFHLVMTAISGNVLGSSEDFRRISNFWNVAKKFNVYKCSRDVWALLKLHVLNRPQF